MLIRTQDKKTLVNMDRLTFIMANEAKDTIGVFVTDDIDFGGGFLIGKYSTMEKSEKVLDMIESQYVEVESPYSVTMNLPYPVFQMPQDEEVPDV